LLAGDTSTGLPLLNVVPAAGVVSNIWAACRDDASIEHAAWRGLKFVVGQAENAYSQAEHIRRYCAAGGTGAVRGVRAIYLAETRDNALSEFWGAFEAYGPMIAAPTSRYTQEAVAAGHLPVRPSTLDEKLHQANIVIGTPDEVTTQLSEYVEITGVDHLDLLVQFPRLSAQRTRQTLELFANEVRPRLGGALGVVA
jgi:alkanesulfonate monooxygenase SsuD/methylene tetrahydromethanopterin reductase-like flavin-dependent oxidoreductase (luciferase family)